MFLKLPQIVHKTFFSKFIAGLQVDFAIAVDCVRNADVGAAIGVWSIAFFIGNFNIYTIPICFEKIH